MEKIGIVPVLNSNPSNHSRESNIFQRRVLRGVVTGRMIGTDPPQRDKTFFIFFVQKSIRLDIFGTIDTHFFHSSAKLLHTRGSILVGVRLRITPVEDFRPHLLVNPRTGEVFSSRATPLPTTSSQTPRSPRLPLAQESRHETRHPVRTRARTGIPLGHLL